MRISDWSSDVCSSDLKPLEDIVAAQWARTSQVLLDDLDALPADRWTGLDYDRFLADPPGEIVRLCQWAGFAWDRELGDTLPLSRYTLTAPGAGDRKRHRLNSSHYCAHRMPSSACTTTKTPP